jgi:hypothetical protein
MVSAGVSIGVRERRRRMTFEQHPIILILFVVLIIEGWNLTKLAIRTVLERRRTQTKET